MKTHSHLLSYVVCNKQDLKRSQSVSVRLVKILIIQISRNLNRSICCRSQDLLKHESVKNLICINDMKYNRFIKLIENKLNYNCVTDTMIYDWAEFARIYISNDLIWFDLFHTLLWHWYWIDSWKTLCYVYWMNKTLWERKSLVDYTATAHRWNNNVETMYSVMNL